MTKLENIQNIIKEIETMKAQEGHVKAGEIKRLENLLFKSQEGGDTLEDLFINALRFGYGNIDASASDIKLFNFLSEGVGANGGFLVPDDILTEVKEIRQQGTDLETLVSVEPVITNKGIRTYERRAILNPLAVVAEGGMVPDVEPDDLIGVLFNITKRAGIINVSAELLEDTNNAIMAWLKRWIAKKSRATRNSAIITTANAITLGSEIPVANVPALRVAVSSGLDDVYKDTAVALMNCTGYETLDAAGVLEKDPTQSKGKLLYGLYPVVSVPDVLLPNGVNDTPIFIGDLKEAITLYDREKASVNMIQHIDTNHIEYASFKLIERIDVQGVDTQAVIKLLLTI